MQVIIPIYTCCKALKENGILFANLKYDDFWGQQVEEIQKGDLSGGILEGSGWVFEPVLTHWPTVC